MFFKTSGNNAETSLPNVIAAIVRWIASFLFYIVSLSYILNRQYGLTSHVRIEKLDHFAVRTFPLYEVFETSSGASFPRTLLDW
jgi:hypothetical protein